ncbi:hypothetical protein TVAG_041370 [Trichomonas vaginalis G3]|uniref:Uncharacterized protein n=1 Tax=Trichomonas vaginalis (strain ATCC PRA-98 / G3) TaxID=412133 RepID=A2G3V1_TRIV3|nr:hypothetical protein TVAGG3_0072040 [Trichomonas vaginalis G3]EAX88173.1 hypothetical protein TVAG_041370 [Trichomonas vaginalis G3]KAI5542568.1 hypothetical protein TVAGG3_0072040 [Trichomonas vaginalis G3]|eukprot:XP_001301103.1 hypothetical protein [Trichomonas vaginalis G3]
MFKWGTYYIPPWTFLFHFLEILCIFFFCVDIVAPTIDGVYHIRKEFIDLFYSSHEEDKPFMHIDEISDYINQFISNFEKFTKNSFSNMEFIDPTHPYKLIVKYKNGTTTDSITVDIDSKFFNHIESLDISTDFLTYSNDTDVIGCTNWNLGMTISTRYNGYEFLPSSYFKRSYCRGKVTYDRVEQKNLTRKRKLGKHNVLNFRTDRVRYDPHRAKYDKKLIEAVKLAIKEERLETFVPPAHERTSDKFNCFVISLYMPMQRFGILFIVLSSLGLYILTF